MSNPTFDNLTSHAREGTLTAEMILEQMAEDRKTAADYDPEDYDSRIEADAAWWCLNPETRRQLLGLTKQEQKEIAHAILSESAWGPAFFRDFEPEVFDWLAELSSPQEVFRAGVELIAKSGWIEWAITRFEKAQVRAVVFHCLTKQDGAAEEFFGGKVDNWSDAFWRLFDTPERFVAAVRSACVHCPERLFTRWAYVGACLTQMSRGLPIESFEHPQDFLPHKREDAEKLALPSMDTVVPLIRFALENLKDGDRINPIFLRHLPLDLRLDVLEHVKRLDEGVELSIALLFDLPREDERSEQVFERLLSRMTAANAPFVYIHALACQMEKGDTVYTRYEKIRGGRHHTSRSQRGIWEERREDRNEILLKSLVRDTWFYPRLREHLVACGWKFCSPKELQWRVEGRLGDLFVDVERSSDGWRQSLYLEFLEPEDGLQLLQLASGCEMIVPTQPWRHPDEVQDSHEKDILIFKRLLPIFDAPLHLQRFKMFEGKAMEAAERRAANRARSHRHG